MEYESPPKNLYRYEKVNHYSMGNLLTSRFYFCPPKNFNDPFDCSLFVKSFECTDEDLIKVFNQKIEKVSDKDKEEIEKGFPTLEDKKRLMKKIILDYTKKKQSDYLERKGVVCFSETFENILMWSHYADGHTGYCIEFDTTKFSYERKERFYKIEYCDKFPYFNPAHIILKTSKNPKEILSPIFTKSKQWEYEKEWRLIHNKANWFYGYGNVITKIILGAKMSNSNKAAISSIIDSKKNKPKILQAKLSKKKYELEFEELTYIPFND